MTLASSASNLDATLVDRWRGPVASLVDGDTASAAEMIAGALAAYRRGPTVGSTTFGKGCAQEYLDDDAHAAPDQPQRQSV